MSASPDLNSILTRNPPNHVQSTASKPNPTQPGKDLRNHPLADRIDSCDSPDSIIDIFQEQSRAFGEFMNGDTKLFKWLRPVVNVLHALSTNSVLSDNGSLVSLAFPIIYSMYLNSISRCFLQQKQFSLVSGSSYPYAFLS